MSDATSSAPEAGHAARTGDAVTVLFFARLREAAGVHAVTVALTPPTTIEALARRLEEERPGLRLAGSLCSVDERYAEPQHVLLGGETVAFLPPISGG